MSIRIVDPVVVKPLVASNRASTGRDTMPSSKRRSAEYKLYRTHYSVTMTSASRRVISPSTEPA